MTFQQALGILNPSDETAGELKAAYRRASLKYHPDRNENGLEMMKLINLAYSFLKDHTGKWSKAKHYNPNEAGLDEVLSGLFDKIKTFVDIRAEICGAWMWVSGNTKTYKEELKDLGFKWSKNKVAWYWHPAGYRKRSKRVFTMNEIRGTWGSHEMDQEPLTAVG